MSKYNEYAQRLDVAFKTAREEYMEAWNQLQAAQKANTDAQAWRAETSFADVVDSFRCNT